MESNEPILTSNLFLDCFGEVVLTLDSGGLSWELVEVEARNYETGFGYHMSKLQEMSTSCLGFKFNSLNVSEIKLSDIYAVENINWGLIHKPTPNTRGLLSEGHSDMYRFVIHGFRRSRAQQSLWVLTAYTFGHEDLHICRRWVNNINACISKDFQRPKSLLVFVHPLSGRGIGRETWENVQPVFSRAKVKTEVIVTQRAGHASDFITSIKDHELNAFDGIIAVGGDGFFNEILNALLLSRHKAPYPPVPHGLMHPVRKNNMDMQNETSHFEEYANGLTAGLSGSSKKPEDEPLLTCSEITMQGISNCREEGGPCDTGQGSTLSFPNNSFRFGIIPAGSTDSIVMSTTGARDPITSALHIILGKMTHLDIAQIVSWKSDNSSTEAHFVRYAASFAGYGFYGDVIKESEKYRWMGPKRYDYAGTKVFLRHRSYEADVAFLEGEMPSLNSGRASEGTGIQPQEISQQSPQQMVCRVNCVVCNEAIAPSVMPSKDIEAISVFPTDQFKWMKLKGHFHSVGAAIISCRNERAPDGLVANAHLADGFMHLVMIKECPRPLYLWHLTQLTRRGSDPLKFEFVEHHKTRAFTFTTHTDESAWNLDGELLQARQLSAQVFRGLVSLFAAGPEV